MRARAGVQVEQFPALCDDRRGGRPRQYLALGDVSGTETIPNDPPIVTPFFFTEGETKNGAFLFGWSLGGGLDVMVMPNVFLRARSRICGFSPVRDIKANITTVRVGAGIKF